MIVIAVLLLLVGGVKSLDENSGKVEGSGIAGIVGNSLSDTLDDFQEQLQLADNLAIQDFKFIYGDYSKNPTSWFLPEYTYLNSKESSDSETVYDLKIKNGKYNNIYYILERDLKDTSKIYTLSFEIKSS